MDDFPEGLSDADDFFDDDESFDEEEDESYEDSEWDEDYDGTDEARAEHDYWGRIPQCAVTPFPLVSAEAPPEPYLLLQVDASPTTCPSERQHAQTQDALAACSSGNSALVAVMAKSTITILGQDESRQGQGEGGTPLALRVEDRFRALNAVYSSAFSSDGRLFAHCGSSLALRLRFVQGGKSKECGGLLLPSLPVPQLYEDLRIRDFGAMINCVRFGPVAGRERIIVSGQDGFIRILELPKPPTAASLEASRPVKIFPEAVCRRLRDGCNPNMSFLATGADVTHTTQEVFLEEPGAHDHGPIPLESHASTVAFGPIPSAVNCCDASPDGRWLAVATDTLSVLLLPEALDYSHLAAMRLRLGAGEGGTSLSGADNVRRAPGCQYVAWSGDSRYLAASSDTHRCVAVWRVSAADAAMAPATVDADLSRFLSIDAGDVHRSLLDALNGVRPISQPDWGDATDPLDVHFMDRESLKWRSMDVQERRKTAWAELARVFWSRVDVQPVALFRDHPYPCLALAWHPAVPSLLLYALEFTGVTCVDVRRPSLARQVLALRGEGHSEGARFVTLAPGSSPEELLEFVPGTVGVAIERGVTGACAVADAFAVSTGSEVHMLPVVTWSKATHRLWPRRFKEVVQLLLLNDRFGNPRPAGAEQEELVLRDLPAGALDLVIQKAARVRHEWV